MTYVDAAMADAIGHDERIERRFLNAGLGFGANARDPAPHSGEPGPEPCGGTSWRC